jgi:hypothetical protein
MKLGRNETCYCWSWKKHKKCCLEKDSDAFKKAEEYFLNQRMVSAWLKRIWVYIWYKFVKPVAFNGEMMRALANVVYRRPITETFHEFLVYILAIRLWNKWFSEQEVSSKQHFIYKCYSEYNKWKIDGVWKNPSETRIAMQPNGYVLCLTQLAYDIVSLVQTSNLESSKLIRKFKEFISFQWTRYEVAIAWIFARLWFKIEFLDKWKQSEKHCEFNASSKELWTTISVEAKSKHRNWVLHQNWLFVLPKDVMWDIIGLIGDALTQNPNKNGFIVFVDLNLPNFTQDEWQNHIKTNISQIINKKYEKELLGINALVITNFSSHYFESNVVPNWNYLIILPHKPSFEIPVLFYEMLENVLGNYNIIPDLERI